MSKSKLEDLGQIIADDTLPLAARRTAAEHYVEAMIADLPEAGDDDSEVINLTRGWEDKKLAELMADVTNGRSLTGFSLPDAKDSVQRRRRGKMLWQLHTEHDTPLVREVAGRMIGKTNPVRRAN